MRKVKKKVQTPVVEKPVAKVEETPTQKPEDKPADFGHPKLVILAPEDKNKRERIEVKIRYEKTPVPSAKDHSSKKKKPTGSTQKAPIRSPKKGQKRMGQSQPKLSVEKKKPKNTSQLTASPQKKKKAVVKKVVKKVPSSKTASHPQSKQNASSQKKKPANHAQPSKLDASKPNGK